MGRPAVFNGLQYHTDPDNGGGGKLIWSARFFDGLIFWCFHYCRARNACNLKACGGGKYLPAWRTRNPTRRNKYPS